MQTDNEYLQCLGLGLQGLRASGQFCDAMVCVGSTRILVHKVVLSAASKTLHDLALEFDMTPHRERDQLEIIIPPDISLYAVNMFINYLYTACFNLSYHPSPVLKTSYGVNRDLDKSQIELRERIVDHLQRLARQFGVSSLINKCQEFIQRTSAPDSQNLNLGEGGNQIEPDSSSANGVHVARQEDQQVIMPEDRSLERSLTRSNSSCSGLSADMSVGYGNVSVKLEPHQPIQGPSTQTAGCSIPGMSPNKSPKGGKKMTMLEKLMSPVVNLKKLPSNITPEVVVMISDDENEDENRSKLTVKSTHQYTLEEKEAIAIEAKRLGTTQVSQSRNIPLHDVLSWMALFGLRNPGSQKALNKGKQVNHDADLAIVRWIVQQQDLNGCVDLNCMKKYALTVHRQTQPKFSASTTWLGNFLQRNLSVLQGTKFVHDDENSDRNEDPAAVAVKKELMSVEDLAEMNQTGQLDSGENLIGSLGEHTVLDDVSLNEQRLVNEALGAVENEYSDNEDTGFSDINFEDSDISETYSPKTPTNSAVSRKTPSHERAVGSILTPFGKRPIIVGQAKCFDAKAERKIVQWVLERNTRDGYVFTDDFKDYARSLYTGSKPFGATQAWMKKFLRRNRALKDVRFCSKFKNTYSTEEKMSAVAMARRFGTSYAAKHTGINQKIIHSWKLAMDRGQLTPSASVVSRIHATSTPIPPDLDMALTSLQQTPEASHGIVPEFENQIIQKLKEHQEREGSISYDEISKISQEVYKETRPLFKASYKWIKSFLDRHVEDTKGLDIENVSKVMMEDETPITNDKITEMVDNALKEIEAQEAMEGDEGDIERMTPSAKLTDKRPIIIGPSVSFDRKTEKLLVDWAIERQDRDGYVFTDDFKDYARSLHKGTKRFSASSGWMSLFLRRHRNLRHVMWKSKFKNNYTEAEKMAAVAEAKRLGTGHVGRKLGIDPALICAWRIKLEKSSQKQTFWKGTKIRKFGKGIKPKLSPIKLHPFSQNDAVRGIVPEFEQRIVQLILQEHEKEGSISYEEISSISQSIYKETRPAFKASYAWIRNFMKRHESILGNINIDNVKKVFVPEEDENSENTNSMINKDEFDDFQLLKSFQKRPIIVGQSRSLDTKTEKKLVQWLVEQQAKDGYVFLDQFKSYAQSLYKGNKKFAATQAWRIKFMRRNHAAVKHVKITSSFRNQYSLEEKKAIVLESKKLGTAHVSKKTGIDHCLINAWKLKLERSGDISVDNLGLTPSHSGQNTWTAKLFASGDNVAQKLKQTSNEMGPGLYSHRGIVPKFEKKIVMLVNQHMNEEGSVTYQDVSNIARAVYKETRPHFKACYNWIKEFIKRHKKELRDVEFEHTRKILLDDGSGMEILIPEDKIDDVERYMPESAEASMESWENLGDMDFVDGGKDPEIVIENAEDPHFDMSSNNGGGSGTSGPKTSSIDITNIAAKKPIIVGMPVHFDRKTEKKLVEWLVERQEKDGFVFTDDFREYARSWYTGPPRKFAATNAWISKFLRRNKLGKKIEFQSRLKGNNPKFEEKIVQLILDQQEKEGSVSNDDIQRITQSVYREIRPNFRACYNWIKDFIKRHKEELAEVELENVKKVFIPDDDNEKDGVLIRDYDPMKGLSLLDNSSESRASLNMDDYEEENSMDSSWVDLDNSPTPSTSQSSVKADRSSLLHSLLTPKRPIIIAPPKSLDIKTEKKLVQWMLEQQQEQGCVYLDLFKDYAKSIHTGPKKFAATQAWMIKFKQRNHEALKNVAIKSRFRNEYSLEEKMAAVEEARRLGCNHVGRKLGINGSVIYTWKIQLEQAERIGAVKGIVVDTDTEKESARGMVPEFEERIIEMVLEKQAVKNSVSYEDISQIARSVYCITRPHFKASYNWVVEFIRKHKERFESVNFENQRKVLTDEEKLHILSEEKKYGTDHVTKKRNISASTIYNWKRNMMAKSIPIPKYKALVGNKIKQKYAKGKKAKKHYSLEEKRRIVSIAEENGITYTSIKLAMPRKLIANWVKYFRDKGENIVIKYTPASTVKKELEQKVVSWVMEQNDQIGVVMTNRIQEYAKKVFEEAYTNFTATDHWLEVFIAQNAEKFEKVRFREKGDTDLDFTNEVKLKLSRYAERFGAVATANKSGLSPKNIYHWRRCMKQKGFDLAESPSPTTINTDSSSSSSKPKSLMQQKLDKIEQKYSEDAKKAMVAEANAGGASVTASKNKIPLPLLLKWMKLVQERKEEVDSKPQNLLSLGKSFSISSKESTPESTSHGKLKVRFPSVEKTKGVTNMNRYSLEFRQQMCNEAKKLGVMETSRKNGIPNSTLYAWVKEYGGGKNQESWRKSLERSRSSVESSQSSFDSELDTSIPISVQDIKKEPVESPDVFDEKLSNELAGSSRIVRRYSESEKFAAAKRAMKIGCKKTSLEMDIPLSNVRRWTTMFKKKVKRSDVKEKKSSLKQGQKLSSSYQSDYGDSSVDMDLSGNDSSVSFSDTSVNAGKGVKRKAEAMLSVAMFSGKQRKFYSDDEKLNFVIESDIHGSKSVAEKAGVSIDVLYKWRQKFSGRVKQKFFSSATATSGLDSSDGEDNLMNELSSQEVGDVELDDEIIETDISNTKEIENEGVGEDISKFNSDFPARAESDKLLKNEPGITVSNDRTTVQETTSDIREDLLQPNIDNMSEMSTIFQSATSKVLAMTADYIEAEMEHEKNQQSPDIQKDQESSDIQKILPKPHQYDTLNTHEPETIVEKNVEESVRENVEKDKDEPTMFKIVDVKSEAPEQKWFSGNQVSSIT